jgi:polysaccharide export outer membrane protein
MKRIKKAPDFFSCILILFSCLVFGCGDPKINAQHTNFKKTSTEPMIPADYLIGDGDQVEISYYIDPGTSVMEYLIDTEDTLRIEFYYYPGLSKTVQVRPDGFITLSRVGDVKAVGIPPEILAEKIKELYAPFLIRPEATVELIDFNVKIEKLKAAVRTTTRGQAKEVMVRPDGKISLPYLQDVMVRNLNCIELSSLLQKKYRKFVKNISINVSILKADSYRAYIMGEIERADFYKLSGPLTLSQLIAWAGGFTEQANTHQIVLIRRGKDGKPDARLIDMNNIIGRGDINSDPIIKQYDIVFVPKTKLSQAALVMDSIINMIPINFSASYSLGGKDTE